MSTVRDKLWLFASRAHDDDVWLGKSMNNRFTRWSRITPAEGALMLDVPNIIMINSDGIPVPYSAEAYGYAESFSRMKNVVWSITGSGRFRVGNEEQFICDLAEKYPNISGAFADDFLGAGMPGNPEEKRELILRSRRELDKACRKMKMWLTVYTRDLDKCDAELYGLFDCLSMWTWEYQNLKELPENFEKLEKKFPNQKKYIGVYILDYPSGEPVPNEYMELQCEFALKMLREKRAEGIIFLTNCVMGVGLPSDYWLRNWIDRVKNIELK